MNSNFISDKRMIKWNDTISPFVLKPLQGNVDSYPMITLWTNYSWAKDSLHFYDTLENIDDVMFEYKFTFSVSKNRISQFSDILNDILKLPVSTKFYFNNKSKPIEISDSIVSSINEIDHQIYEKTYRRYTYNFIGNFSSVIMYVNCIIDAISYFEMIWGYDENGKEYCLLEYPIGSIVSLESDKSKDFLVLEYDYNKSTTDEYRINFICCEMLTTTKSDIIQYGKSSIYRGDQLCYSRNNRIDDILN